MGCESRAHGNHRGWNCIWPWHPWRGERTHCHSRAHLDQYLDRRTVGCSAAGLVDPLDHRATRQRRHGRWDHEFLESDFGDRGAHHYRICSCRDTILRMGLWHIGDVFVSRNRQLYIFVGQDRTSSAGAGRRCLTRWINRGAGCSGGDAAVDQQRLSGDVATGLGGKEDDWAIQIVRLARTFRRNAVDQVVDPILTLIQHLVLCGAKPARSEAIHRDTVLAPIIGEAHGELPDTSTTRSIGSQSSATEDAGDRSDIHDAAISIWNHAARY